MTLKNKLGIASAIIGIAGWALCFDWLGWKTAVVLLLVMTANNMDLKNRLK